MTIQPVLFPLSVQILFDANGCAVRGGSLLFFDAETTNPRTVYQDAKLTSAHPTPVPTDYFGRIPAIWIGLGSYKCVLQDSFGAQLAVIDDMPGGVDVTPASVVAQPIQTGMIVAAHTNDAFDGWLPLNGKTIGNPNSGGTARANADCVALYTKLWNQDASLTVNNGGRGQTATADFAAGKTITLPDYRGRVFAGVDQMGAAATAGVITAASVSTPNAIGASFGTEKLALTQAQLPAVAPTITVQSATHTHTAATDAQGQHGHTLSTGAAGNHYHGYRKTSVSQATGGGGPAAANNGDLAANTDPVGDHTHSISPDGLHSHNVTLDGGGAGGAHTHTASSSNLGSGAAHPNMPPAVLGYWLIKL